jgi:arginyl-tRNA synthetase
LNYQIAKIPNNLNEEELSLLRTFYQFPEVIFAAAEQFSPHLLAQYLFDLAQKFNLFYQKHRILPKAQSPKPPANFRLFLTATTAQILKKGLAILGIEAPERM